MVPGFELLFDYDNKLPELKKEDTNWVPIDWTGYMNPDAMTTLLGDAICNIEEEEYWEACQHALKSPYETRIDDENEKGGKPLMMMMKAMTAIVIIVAIAVVVTAEIVGKITVMIVILKRIVAKIRIAKIVAMIGENPLVIERMKMWDLSIKTSLMMMWTTTTRI